MDHGFIRGSIFVMRRFLRSFLWLVCAFVLATKVVEWTTEAWFFEELGYFPVFRRLMLMRGALFGSGTAFSALLLWLNLRHAKRVVAWQRIIPAQRLIPLHDKRILNRFRRFWASAALLFLVILSGSYAAVHDLVVWHTLAFENTGIIDPIFGRDLAFYLFQLPALNFLWTFVFILLWMNLLLVALIYAYEDVWQTRGRISTISPEGTRHLSTLVAALLLWKALGYRLSAWNMITARGEPLGGLDYTALHFRLPIFVPLAVFAVLAALALWRASRLKANETRAARRVLLFWAGANLFLGTLVPLSIENIYVKPRRDIFAPTLLEQRREATRTAFSIHNVREADFRADWNDLESNVPLWTPEFLKTYFNRTQRRGDDFIIGSAHFDRYQIDGAPRTVFVAPREATGNGIGNDLIFCDATKISLDGQPLIYDAAHFPEVRAGHPEIVFGSGQTELPPDFLSRGRNAIPDFWQRQAVSAEPTPYSLISSEKYQFGLNLKPFWRRFLLSWRFFDKRLLGAQNQKLIWHRQVVERCKQIAPYFVYGEPRPALLQGRIVWLIAAHSVADSYPLAFASQNSKINYLRTGAVAVVDAYDGGVQFFALDESDCLLQAHRRLFPEIFQDFSLMPTDLRAHLALSPLQFAAQSDLWARVLAPSPDEILQKKPLVPTSLRQAVPWNNTQTVAQAATPFFAAHNLHWIQLFSEETQFSDEKSLSTPVNAALVGEMTNGQPQLRFWRAKNAISLPQIPEKGLFSFNSVLIGDELLMRGVQIPFLNRPLYAFWFSGKSGFQQDLTALIAAKWSGKGRN